MGLQSILFDRRNPYRWTKPKAIAWLKRNKKRYGKVDYTPTYIRFRQYDPKNRPMRTITLKPGIKAIADFRRKKK